MCGRYTVAGKDIEVEIGERLMELHFDEPRYNLGPMQWASVVRRVGRDYAPGVLRWGLVPGWAKDEKIAVQCINARSETVAEKPSFRSAFKSRRCLVPADGFFEWQKVGKAKVPWRFVRPDGGAFVFAGLWESWQPTDRETKLETFTILTTEPNRVAGKIHDRMPVILDAKGAEEWLDPERGRDDLLKLCRPAPDNVLTAYSVNAVVGNVRNQGPECIEPVGA